MAQPGPVARVKQMAPQEKQVEFNYTVDDIKAHYAFCNARNGVPERWPTRLSPWLLAMALLVSVRVFAGPEPLSATALGLCVSGLAYQIISSRIRNYSLERWQKRWYEALPTDAPHLFESQLHRVTPTGFFFRDARGESVTYWGALDDVAETCNAVYFVWSCLNDEHPAAILSTPRHAFASDAEMHQLAELARGFLNEAQAVKSATAEPSPTRGREQLK